MIRCLKAYYRRELSKLRLYAFENEEQFTVDVLQAMKLLRTAWEAVSPNSIQNCFRKAGFSAQGKNRLTYVRKSQSEKSNAENIINSIFDLNGV